jgi:uncharacterized membrane protein (DUF485 family)
MSPLDHGPAHPPEVEDPRESARHARIGLWLFAVYFVFYISFMLLSAFAPQVIAMRVAGDVNLAVVYGFGLIGLAGVIALAYGWLCRQSGGTES